MKSAAMPVTGRDIIEDLVQRMRTESEPLRYSALAHGVYRVFLHREDYERLAPAQKTLIEEARRALDEELERLNADRLPASDQFGRLIQKATRLVKPPEPPIRRPAGGWVIELYPDEDQELPPGHFRITSELGLPETSQTLGGEPTQRVQPVGTAADVTRRTTATAVAAGPAWGELTYRDNLGREHVEPLSPDLVRVGRGGRGADVDVVISGPEDVSRVHLHLRRAPTGEVALKDVSRFGTTIDNVRVPPSLEAGGVDADRWVPLPDRAQIGLAGVIVLHFRLVPGS
ncbi:MAG TPA: FHA domain-containing protein [Vicinamibacterales bacterium]